LVNPTAPGAMFRTATQPWPNAKAGKKNITSVMKVYLYFMGLE
jgi:hypothetical protein